MHGTTHGLDDGQLARWLADQSGTLLTTLRAAAHNDATALRAAGDQRSHELLMAHLSELRPADAVLSEEGLDDPARRTADRVWIVDPLDGTREFGELDRDDWAVHVALWHGGDLVAGAVALPALGRTLATDVPSTPDRHDGRPRIVVSRTRPPTFTEDVASAVQGTVLPMGSAGAKVAAVIRGAAEVYVHAGGQYEWDSAAPVAVARAAGLHCSRIDGSPLRYNQPDPTLPDLVVCRPELTEIVLRAIAEHSEATTEETA